MSNATYILHRFVPDLRLELEEDDMYDAHNWTPRGRGLEAIEGLKQSHFYESGNKFGPYLFCAGRRGGGGSKVP